MTGITDRLDLGYFPLQDHDPQVPLGTRQSLGGARVAKLTDASDAGDNVDATVAKYARVNNMGTLGDVHPWMFLQTRDRSVRAMGMWAQAFAAMTVGGGEGGFGQHTGTEPTASVLSPLRGTQRGRPAMVTDARIAGTVATYSKALGSVPQGTLMVLMPGTEETKQIDLMMHADPRIVCASAEGPGEASTLVVDLQPNGELCMDGSIGKPDPGVGGRQARISSIFRVIATDGVPHLGGRGNLIALNHTASDQEGQPGYGAVWATMASGGGGGPTRPGGGGPTRPGGGGPTRPGGGSGPTRPGGGPTGPIRPGGRTSRDSGPRPEGSSLGADSGESSMGSGASGAQEGTGGSDISKGIEDFGRFSPKPKRGKGVAFMAHVGACGPLHPGAGGDKHQIGLDKDGHPMNSGHIATEAYFYRDQQFDGPLLFEGIWPDDVKSFPLKSYVHLEWDEGQQHKSVAGNGRGKWRWWAEVPDMTPTPPTTTPPTISPPTTRPTGPGNPGPGGPTRPGGPGPTGPGPTRPGGGPGGGPIRPGPGPGRSWVSGPSAGGGGGPTRPGGGGGGPTRPGGSGSAGHYSGGGAPGPEDRGGPRRPGPAAPGAPAPGSGPPGPGDDGWDDSRFLGSGGIIPVVGPIGGPGGGGTGPGGGPAVDIVNVDDANPWTGESRTPPGVVQAVGDAGVEARGLYTIFRPFASSFGGALSYRPQLWLKGYPNFERNPSLEGRMYELDEHVRPQVLAAHPWGGTNTADGDWSYVIRPDDSRARGGVANGGLIYHPPEFEMEDYFGINSAVNTDAPSSVGYVGHAPGVRVGFGAPNIDGTMADGSTVIYTATAGGDLVVGQLASGAVTEILQATLFSGEPFVNLLGTGSVRVPTGTTAQRPSLAVEGEFRVNSTTKRTEFYNGTQWVGGASESEVAAVLTDAFLHDGSQEMTGAAAGFAGTAALPGYAFDGDLNTGMWRPAAGVLAFSTGGVERVRVDSAGDLTVVGSAGIGGASASSAYTLSVAPSTSGAFHAAALGSDDWACVFTGGTNNGSGLKMRGVSGSELRLKTGTTTSIKLSTADASYVDNGQNFGIGTSSPSGKLHVVGTGGDLVFEDVGELTVGSQAQIGPWTAVANYAVFAHANRNTSTGYALIQNTDGTTYINSETGKALSMRIGNATKAQITSAGNLIVGSSTDLGGKLQVIGEIRGRDVDTNLAIKDFLITASDYTNANPPTTLIRGKISSTANQLWIGGDNLSSGYGATAIKIMVAPTKTSTAHVEEVRIVSGAVRVGGTGTPTERLEVHTTFGNDSFQVLDATGNCAMNEGLAIGTNVNPNGVAVLDCVSTTKGFLPPRMTTTQRNAMAAVAGLVIYNTTTNKLNVYTGSAWEAVTSA